jgi:hypothetical protein
MNADSEKERMIKKCHHLKNISVCAGCIHAASYPSSKFSKLSMSIISSNKETAVSFLKYTMKLKSA